MAELDVDKFPAGNWIAHHLRLVNDDSKKLFPSTAGSKRSYRKYDSLYMVDFEDFPDGALTTRMMDKLNLEEIQKKRETIADVLFNSNTREPGHMFGNWTIPERILDKESSKGKRNVRKVKKTADDNSPSTLPVIRKKTPGARHPSPALSSQLPKMSSKSARPPTKPVAKSLPCSPVRRAKSVGAHDHDRLKEELRASLKPGAVGLAEDWMKDAPHMDREVVQKLLRMQEKSSHLDQAMKKTLLPDARQAVEKWLDRATESERQVALKFFTSLAGSKLMGLTANEQRSRFQQVISTLQRNQGRGTPGLQTDPQLPARTTPAYNSSSCWTQKHVPGAGNRPRGTTSQNTGTGIV
ncbi:uncharacterized protein LOC124278833 [Haliotis rubra]|uniref:uncharacterized protein LOC124278833 n=1 Tax=Haliotis rubra TaxID=36100 RepID=UPI001EE59916|nr:uncharacterized protein LOC124278833 [Haliotis rubra]